MVFITTAYLASDPEVKRKRILNELCSHKKVA
jgi:hypothetical protein